MQKKRNIKELRNLLSNIKMSEQSLTFGDIEIEKKKILSP